MPVYLNVKQMSLSHTPPGAAIPLPVAFLVMPVVGLAFLMFLPAVGFVLVGKHLVVECAKTLPRIRAWFWREA
jgi:hypothetical protein